MCHFLSCFIAVGESIWNLKKYWKNAHEPPLSYLIRIGQAFTLIKRLNPPPIDLYVKEKERNSIDS